MFALTPGAPFSDFASTINAAWLNFVRTALPSAVDGVGGGTYNLAGDLIFPSGGSGIDIGANLKIRDGEVPSGGQFYFKTGSLGVVEASSGFNVDGTLQIRSGGVFNCLSGGAIALKSGSTTIGEVGSLVTLRGATLIEDGGGGGSNGTLTLGGAGHAGKLKVTSLGDIVMDPGSGLSASGTLANPTVISLAGDGSGFHCSLELTNSAFLSTDSTTDVNIGGGLLFHDATQAGALTKSGNSAATLLRKKTIPNTGSTVSFTASQADVWEIAGTVFSGGVTATIASESTEFEFTIVQSNPNCGDQVLIQENGGTSMGTFNPIGTSSFTNGVRAACRYRHRSDGTLFIVSYWDGTGGSNSTSLFTPP